MSSPIDNPRRLLWDHEPPGWDSQISQALPSLTPYVPESERPPACVLVCPGGGYAAKADHEAEPVALWLNSCGVAAAVLDYRVAPYRHPWPWTDASRAIRWIRSHADEIGLDGARVGILGFSAGGHLAASTGIHWDEGHAESVDAVDRQSSRPDLMVLCYPVISFAERRHHGSMVNLLGEEPDPDLRRELSLETGVSADTPPSFIWHTADDAAVPVQNSLGFAGALAEHDVPVELHVFPHGRHGLGLATGEPHVAGWTDLCAQWLRSRGFGQ